MLFAVILVSVSSLASSPIQTAQISWRVSNFLWGTKKKNWNFRAQFALNCQFYHDNLKPETYKYSIHSKIKNISWAFLGFTFILHTCFLDIFDLNSRWNLPERHEILKCEEKEVPQLCTHDKPD